MMRSITHPSLYPRTQSRDGWRATYYWLLVTAGSTLRDKNIKKDDNGTVCNGASTRGTRELRVITWLTPWKDTWPCGWGISMSFIPQTPKEFSLLDKVPLDECFLCSEDQGLSWAFSGQLYCITIEPLCRGWRALSQMVWNQGASAWHMLMMSMCSSRNMRNM